MSSRRTIILILALVLSALSVFGIFSYVRGVEDSANEEQVIGTYWVVAVEIPKGTNIERVIAEEMLIQVDVPLDLVPSTIIADPASELGGRVAVTNLPANTPIIEGLFLTADVISTGITERLAEMEMVTVTVSVDQVRSAAYQIEPGDYVNILSVFDYTRPEDPEQQGLPLDQRTDIAFEDNRDGVTAFGADVRYVLQNVEVLAIDQELTPQLGDSAAPADEEGAVPDNTVANRGLVTLAVPPEAVQLILSIGFDHLYFSLVPQNYEPRAIVPIDIDLDRLPGEIAEQLTPYGPNGAVTQEDDEQSVSR